jgi:hypothetical protein
MVQKFRLSSGRKKGRDAGVSAAFPSLRATSVDRTPRPAGDPAQKRLFCTGTGRCVRVPVCVPAPPGVFLPVDDCKVINTLT